MPEVLDLEPLEMFVIGFGLLVIVVLLALLWPTVAEYRACRTTDRPEVCMNVFF